ncbi:glycosyltransferase family 4 protein [Gryllotalpicola daejeonensis]|uniref:D-inositol 3-phosphate glycosyltransferase n=1 Tax=Gryllotalpicola daejeonensis TaxID=993087 RepID=A0ABP7ZN89_9MICO
MRVTIASRIFTPEAAAASFRLSALTDALADAGHAVKVLTTTAPAGLRGAARASDAARRGVTVRRLPVLRDADDYVRGYLQYLSFDLPLLFRLISGRRPDAIVVEPPPTTGFVTRIAAGIRRVPYVYYAADIWSDATASMGASSFVTRALRVVERFAMRGAAHVIAVTDGVAERVREIAGHDRVTVVRNGIDTTVFTPDGPVDDVPPTAVYAGTMSEWQGADVFVRAWPAVLKRVPGARLVFAGGGTARDELQSLARELRVEASVSFTGVIAPPQAARLLRSARVGLVSIVPGTGYDFAVPTKILASAACGTPVVFAGRGASAELIAGAALGTCSSHDPAAVAAAVSEALEQAPSPVARAAVADWTLANVSIAAVAERVAAIITHAGRTSS